MLFAAIGQCGCMAILAGCTSVSFYATGIIAAAMLFLFNFFFAVGLLAIPWLLPAEYAPSTHPSIRRCSRFSIQLDFYFPRGRNYPNINQINRSLHIRLFLHIQRLLRTHHLLFLPRDSQIVFGAN